jgi:DNA-binding transcriptional LysR family regulator
MADIEALKTFVTVVRSRSFAGAARALGLTPAMIGRRIQELERLYGVRLIERTTRAQHLTDAGEAFLARANAVLEAVADLEDSMSAAPGMLRGRIRMTAPATLGIHSLASIVARFQQANPAVTMEMVLSDRRMDIVADGFDFAVRIGDLQSSSLIARRVGNYGLTLVAAPSYLAGHGAPTEPADLVSARCLINLNMTPRNRWPFRRADKAVFPEIQSGLQIDNGEALRVATLEGAGISYLPVDLVRADLSEGRLVRLLPDWDTMSLPIHLLYPSRRYPSRIAALLDMLATELSVSHPV